MKLRPFFNRNPRLFSKMSQIETCIKSDIKSCVNVTDRSCPAREKSTS